MGLPSCLWKLHTIYETGSCHKTVHMLYDQEVLSNFINKIYHEFGKDVLYVQEVVTLQKKYLIYLHQNMRFTPFINYFDTLVEHYSFKGRNNFRSHEFNWIK